jgi:transcriptional regulator with XRE-family HTH domain
METVCKRADISRPTLKRIESGDPSVSFGNLVQVLKILGFQDDIALLLAEDVIGRKIQDESLPLPRRSPRQTKSEDE